LININARRDGRHILPAPAVADLLDRHKIKRISYRDLRALQRTR
jgi:hypothetical protein